MILENPIALWVFLALAVLAFFLGVVFQRRGVSRNAFNVVLIALCVIGFSMFVLEAFDQQSIVDEWSMHRWKHPDQPMVPLGHDPSRTIVACGAIALLPLVGFLLGTVLGARRGTRSFLRLFLDDLIEEFKRPPQTGPESPRLKQRRWLN